MGHVVGVVMAPDIVPCQQTRGQHTLPLLRLCSYSVRHASAGMGGRVADALAAQGIVAAAQLRPLPLPSLESMLSAAGLASSARSGLAVRLHAWSQGIDDSPVAVRGPPRSIQAQMTLTPVPLAMPKSLRGTTSVAGGPPGRLEPLLVSGTDAARRMERLMRAMATDIAARVVSSR